MVFDVSSNKRMYLGDTVQTAVKLSIVGSFGVGKTTFIKSISEIKPLTTEAVITQASEGIDDLHGIVSKTTTTVALDFGRITLNERLVLYLFGTPGQDRFASSWKAAVSGSIGTLVLVDTRRLDLSFDILEQVELHYQRHRQGMPYVVAVNQFDDANSYSRAELREALDLDARIPLITCDARSFHSSLEATIKLVEHSRDVMERYN